LINAKNFFLRPMIMGRSVHMNEGLVFVIIMIATIREGIIGALLVVPLVASVVVIAGYVRRKVLGMPAFEDDGSMQFVAPPEKIRPVRRNWTGKKRTDSPTSEPDLTSQKQSSSKRTLARKKSKK